MVENGDTFKEHRLLILDALKRHEDRQQDSDKENKKEHAEIMTKLNHLNVTVTANEREMKIKQGFWGGLGGAAVMGIKMLFDGFGGK